LFGKCWHSFVLIKLLWTRFGSSIRRVWHETATRVILFIYLSALPPSSMFVFNPPLIVFLYFSQSAAATFPTSFWFFFYSCVYAAYLPSINIIIVILVDTDITVYYIPGRVLTLTFCFLPTRHSSFSIQFS